MNVTRRQFGKGVAVVGAASMVPALLAGEDNPSGVTNYFHAEESEMSLGFHPGDMDRERFLTELILFNNLPSTADTVIGLEIRRKSGIKRYETVGDIPLHDVPDPNGGYFIKWC